MGHNGRGMVPGEGTEGKLVHFGSYRGIPWSEVPSSYLEWLTRQKYRNVRTSKAAYELER